MELGDLRAFLRIAALGSISAAARALGQPKSSVSRGLARLEQSVGAALFDRSSQHLRLTDAGSLLRGRAGRIIDEADDVQAALDGLAEHPRGRLKINAPYTFAVGLIGPMLAGFAHRYPHVAIVLDIDNKVVDLHAADLDLAVRVGTLADSDLVAQKLTTVALWACASSSYLNEHGTPERPADLAGHRLIVRMENRSTWGFRRPDGEPVELDVPHHLVVPEPAIMLTLTLDGAGISRLPDFVAAEAVADGRLVRLFPEYEPDAVDVHVLYTSRRALPTKARVFIDALLDHLEGPGSTDGDASRPGSSTRPVRVR